MRLNISLSSSSQEFESFSQGQLPSMNCRVLAQLLWAMTCLKATPSWFWLSIAAEPLSDHELHNIAATHPHDLARALAGMHAQLQRPDSMDAFISAATAGTSTTTAAGKTSRGSRDGTPTAASNSLYCSRSIHLSTLSPQAPLVAAAARRAAAAWLECSSVSTLQGLPTQILETAVRAVAAMNMSLSDPLCTLILPQLTGEQQALCNAQAGMEEGEEWVWPSRTSWESVLHPSALAAPRLVPDSAWLELVGKQLIAAYLSQAQAQQQPQQQLLQSECSLAALLAVQMRMKDTAHVTAPTELMRASLLNAATPQQDQQQQSSSSSATHSQRMATLIQAAVMVCNEVPSPYVQHFLGVTIQQVCASSVVVL